MSLNADASLNVPGFEETVPAATGIYGGGSEDTTWDIVRIQETAPITPTESYTATQLVEQWGDFTGFVLDSTGAFTRTLNILDQLNEDKVEGNFDISFQAPITFTGSLSKSLASLGLPITATIAVSTTRYDINSALQTARQLDTLNQIQESRLRDLQRSYNTKSAQYNLARGSAKTQLYSDLRSLEGQMNARLGEIKFNDRAKQLTLDSAFFIDLLDPKTLQSCVADLEYAVANQAEQASVPEKQGQDQDREDPNKGLTGEEIYAAFMAMGNGSSKSSSSNSSSSSGSSGSGSTGNNGSSAPSGEDIPQQGQDDRQTFLAPIFATGRARIAVNTTLALMMLFNAACGGNNEVIADQPNQEPGVAQPSSNTGENNPSQTQEAVDTNPATQIEVGPVGEPSVTPLTPQQEFGTGGQAGAPVVTPDLQGPVVVEGEPILPLEYSKFPDLKITGSEASGFRITQNSLGREVTIALWNAENGEWSEVGLSTQELDRIASQNPITHNNKETGQPEDTEWNVFYEDTQGNVSISCVSGSDFFVMENAILDVSGDSTGFKYRNVAIACYIKDSTTGEWTRRLVNVSAAGGSIVDTEGNIHHPTFQKTQQNTDVITLNRLSSDLGNGGDFTTGPFSPTFPNTVSPGEPLVITLSGLRMSADYAARLQSAADAFNLSDAVNNGNAVRLLGGALSTGRSARFFLDGEFSAEIDLHRTGVVLGGFASNVFKIEE